MRKYEIPQNFTLSPSYLNYTGLRKSDSDFDYISIGDINENGLIDAYDISVVATKLEDGANAHSAAVAGSLGIEADKKSYKTGEEVIVTVKGTGLAHVNALSLALPYSTDEYEFVKIEPVNGGSMQNFSKNRMHSNGETAVYPTFVNIGEKPALEGDVDIAKITFKAKNNIRFDLKAVDTILVDKALNNVE